MKSTMQKKLHKRELRAERRKNRQQLHVNPQAFTNDEYYQPISKVKQEVKPLRPLTERQATYLELIKRNVITFGLGCAGTGKSYVAAGWAADQLKEGAISRIVITRPAVTADEEFGFLPGDLEEKFEPYLAPFIDIFEERLGKSQTKYFMSHGQIIAKPLAFMRGSTFKGDNRDSQCVVLFDEAQNATPSQLRLLLTRIGTNCKVIINGDLNQKDISGTSGLEDALYRLRNVASVGSVEFDVSDVVRSGICRDILLAYS